MIIILLWISLSSQKRKGTKQNNNHVDTRLSKFVNPFHLAFSIRSHETWRGRWRINEILSGRQENLFSQLLLQLSFWRLPYFHLHHVIYVYLQTHLAVTNVSLLPILDTKISILSLNNTLFTFCDEIVQLRMTNNGETTQTSISRLESKP